MSSVLSFTAEHDFAPNSRFVHQTVSLTHFIEGDDCPDEGNEAARAGHFKQCLPVAATVSWGATPRPTDCVGARPFFVPCQFELGDANARLKQR